MDLHIRDDVLSYFRGKSTVGCKEFEPVLNA
jgi:hypothetical protein